MKILILFLSFILAGCVTAPKVDTPEKALKAANITWINTLGVINKNAHRMTATQKTRVRDAVMETQKAWNGANIALSLKNNVDFVNNLSVINTSIDILRAILEEIESKEVTHGYSIESNYFA